MELKKENEDSCKASFLDFSIEVHNRKFTTKLLHKRIAFPFYINRRPYLDSNAPSKIFYALVGSKMLRVARATTEHMVTHIKLLWIPMKKQGSERVHIILLLKKIFGKRLKVFLRFEDTANEIIKLFSL